MGLLGTDAFGPPSLVGKILASTTFSEFQEGKQLLIEGEAAMNHLRQSLIQSRRWTT